MYKHKLFGLNKDGSFKVWDISVEKGDNDVAGCVVVINYGSEGGKLTQSREAVFEGKQKRTVYEQAVLKAEARLKKQLDKGYRYTKEELTSLPLLPMLAKDYKKEGHRIKFPCLGCVKFDGLRGLAKKVNGVVQLSSRTGQPYSVPHLEEQLNQIMEDGAVLDGEIYYHGAILQDIKSATDRTEPQKEIEKILRAIAKEGGDYRKPSKVAGVVEPSNDELIEHAEYIATLRRNLKFYIFDMPEEGVIFSYRHSYMFAFEDFHDCFKRQPNIIMTGYDWIEDEDDLKTRVHPAAVARGYEGVMLRNLDGLYESGKKSADLQKYKTMIDSEFLILDVIADKQGNGVFVLQNDLNKLTFTCVMGSLEERRAFLENAADLVGQYLTVDFQSRFKDTLLPQFPAGKAIRKGTLIDGVFVPAE